MGFSSSQVRLCALTSRKHDITRELMKLSTRKQALVREAHVASEEYNNSFNVNIFKWNNGGTNYQDITYSALMTPTAGVSGSSTPILLTDQQGKVVVNSKYRQYAEMVSPNGQPGGDWESNRITVLSALTGVDAGKIAAAQTTEENLNNATKNVDEAWQNMTNWEAEESKYMKYTTANDLSKKLPSNFADAYSKSSTISSSSSSWSSTMESIKTSMKNWLTDDDYGAWEQACDDIRDELKTSYFSSEDTFKAVSSNSNNPYKISGSLNSFKIDARALLKALLEDYALAGGRYQDNSTDPSLPKKIAIVDRSSGSEWSKWKSEMDVRKAAYDSAVAAEDTAMDANNQSYEDTAQRNLISFYDKLFTAIAEQGWTFDDNASEDKNYLNDMLQNNSYCLTLMSKNNDYVEGSTALSTKNKYDYNIGSAYYNDNLIKVNDPDVRSEALAVYENTKTEINEKESKLDIRMEKLKTELEAINAMIKGTEEVRNKNSETFFQIFA